MGKQSTLPAEGMARPSIPAIDKKVEEYVQVRDERMALTERETELRDELGDLMRDAKLESYLTEDGERLVQLSHKARVTQPKTVE